MEISKQNIIDIRKLLDEGIDDYWWTVEENGNWSLINRLRDTFGLLPISEEYLKEMKEYWGNL